MLCYAMLYYTILYYTILYYTILYDTILYCIYYTHEHYVLHNVIWYDPLSSTSTSSTYGPPAFVVASFCLGGGLWKYVNCMWPCVAIYECMHNCICMYYIVVEYVVLYDSMIYHSVHNTRNATISVSMITCYDNVA